MLLRLPDPRTSFLIFDDSVIIRLRVAVETAHGIGKVADLAGACKIPFAPDQIKKSGSTQRDRQEAQVAEVLIGFSGPGPAHAYRRQDHFRGANKQ